MGGVLCRGDRYLGGVKRLSECTSSVMTNEGLLVSYNLL